MGYDKLGLKGPKLRNYAKICNFLKIIFDVDHFKALMKFVIICLATGHILREKSHCFVSPPDRNFSAFSRE